MSATAEGVAQPREATKTSEPLTQRMAGRFSRGPLYIFLVLVGLFWIIPSFGLLVTSIRTPAAYSESGWWTVFTDPAQITFQNYADLLQNDSIVNGLLNTVKIAVPSSIAVVVVAALAAYAFAWMKFKGRDLLFLLVVAMLVVPLQMALIPASRLFNITGIFGTVWAVILFHIAFGLPFAIFLLRNFFAGIPKDLLEAARIDGASEWQIFRRLILPLGMPAIASLLIFQFLWTWNDLLVGLVFGGESAPLTVLIRQQMRTYGTSIDVIAPGAFLLMIVPLIVFFAFQRYFVQGLLAGAVK
ncbi:MAG: carbohydrate ABC transporter permease [Actinobacteria bacterium]|jgi:alpha-glucoside transport system permease protein|nr:carbohydrate ABC transporter permease [Actinomycetota bacterium]